MQMLSTLSSTSIENVTTALGEPLWFQLYMPASWDETERLVRRVEAADCQVVAWTIDILGGRKCRDRREPGANRHAQLSDVPFVVSERQSGNLSQSGETDAGGSVRRNQSCEGGLEVRRSTERDDQHEIALKGIDTADDAVLAREHGADGVVVSNHGGRATETGRGTIDILPEVVDAVGSHFPVLVDGGFRRGTDVFKALSLGGAGGWYRQAIRMGLGFVRAGRSRARHRTPAHGIDSNDA
jgi:isopentenyl diphosphate isomerase/L-lactate dehydrogenase-like FMN-dependent dehydrogenase